MPETQAGQAVYLYVSGIDFEAAFYVDGELAGEHSGWATPSLIRVPDELLESGQRLLAVRVWNPGGLGGLYSPLGLVITNL